MPAFEEESLTLMLLQLCPEYIVYGVGYLTGQFKIM